MAGGLNELVPKDELNWDPDTNDYTILSKTQVDNVMQACLRVGMKRPKDILKVLNEYENIRAGELLFNGFLSGKLGVYEFSPDGSAVFEPIRSGQKTTVEFLSFKEREVAQLHGNPREFSQRFVVCNSEEKWDVFTLYETILNFCSKWGIDILGGDNPEEAALSAEDQEFMDDIRGRIWSVSEVDSDESRARLRVEVNGLWLRTKY